MIATTDIENFIKYPHVLGIYLGYKDLKDIHTEWIKKAFIKNAPCLQAHRNSYKTTSILIVGIIWYLLFFDKNVSILVIRKAETDAQRIINTLKAHFESDKIKLISKYLYGVDDLKTDVWSNSSIKLSIKDSKTPEGSVDAKGTTSAVTGSHYDFILPDDIITVKDRVSKAEREWIKTFVRELFNIKKENGKIFFSGTPWHASDAWSILPDPVKYPIGTVNIKGYEPANIECKKKELIDQIKSVSLYSANYELVHVANEMSLFPEPVYGPWPEGIETIAYLDPAYSGSNTTGLTIGGLFDGKYYVRGYVFTDSIVDLYDKIVNILKLNNCGSLYIETNADKGLSKIEFEKRWPAVTGRNETENKHIRIMSFAVANFDKLIWHYDTDPDYMIQVLEYQEKIDPDDAPDSLSGWCRAMGFHNPNDVYVGVA